MKKLYYTFFLLFSLNGFTQTLTPEFEFQLYFEDAVGNRDTVTLGYDALATDSIDADFGEVDITDIPWSSDKFEVRINNGGDFSTFSTKKQIVKDNCTDNWFNFLMNPNLVVLNLKNFEFPLKLRISENVSNNFCINNSFLIEDGEPWEKILSLGELYTDDDYSIDEPFYLSLNQYSDNDGKMISFFRLCFADNTLSTLNLLFNSRMNISPNPFTDHVEISSQMTNGKISIYDLQGREVNFYQEGNRVFPLNCNAGIYLLSIEENGKIYNTKIIKQ